MYFCIEIQDIAGTENNTMDDNNFILSHDEAEIKLLTDLFHIVDEVKQKVATTVNTGITLMYWHIGERINKDVLHNERAEYGKQIVSTVSAKLTERYGSDFTPRNVRRMMQFARLFPDLQIVSLPRTKTPHPAKRRMVCQTARSNGRSADSCKVAKKWILPLIV